MSAWVYFVRRVSLLPLILLGLFTVIFLLTHVIPADPARAMAGEGAGEEQILKIQEKFHLNEPLYRQYIMYLGGLLEGDLGTSIHTWRPVSADLQDYFPATLELTSVSMVFAVLIGVLFGTLSAVYKDTLLDGVITVFSVSGLSMPRFWLGIVLLITVCLLLDVFPLGGRINPNIKLNEVTGLYILDSVLTGNWAALKSTLWHICLPAFTLAVTSLGLFSRITRTTLLDRLREDYVRTARAIGNPERTVIWHALRNALIPIVTVMGMQFAFLLGGTVVVETVFDWPGLGLYASKAALTSDYPAITGVTLLFGVVRMLFNLMVDVSYFFLNPKIRQS